MAPSPDWLFLTLLVATILPVFCWAFHKFPKENWQFLASVPTHKDDQGHWVGVNLTYYGLISANAYAVSFLLFLLLASAQGMSLPVALGISAAALACAVPSARLLAWWVEGKKHHLTFSGASFIGLISSPLWIAVVPGLVEPGAKAPMVPTLAAMGIAAVLGEGLGRLACISFGCCYGRPISELPAWLQRFFRRAHFVFSGSTKKIAYASCLDGVKVVPVQAMTAIVNTTVALVALVLLLSGQYAFALGFSITTSLAWRIVSELLRADDLGTSSGSSIAWWAGRWSRYQTLSVIGIFYIHAVLAFHGYSSGAAQTDLAAGFQALWNPAVILLVQAIWIVLFLFSGRSLVTSSSISWHVVDEATA
ncbi:MAG: prolipoprotein diacylglyceryl transferase family protein, partial [Acidobacteriota bacterium]